MNSNNGSITSHRFEQDVDENFFFKDQIYHFVLETVNRNETNTLHEIAVTETVNKWLVGNMTYLSSIERRKTGVQLKISLSGGGCRGGESGMTTGSLDNLV